MAHVILAAISSSNILVPLRYYGDTLQDGEANFEHRLKRKMNDFRVFPFGQHMIEKTGVSISPSPMYNRGIKK